jgi:hypothetical protein
LNTTQKKQKSLFTDALSRLEINSLKIQEEKEESTKLLSGSELSSIGNFKLAITM